MPEIELFRFLPTITRPNNVFQISNFIRSLVAHYTGKVFVRIPRLFRVYIECTLQKFKRVEEKFLHRFIVLRPHEYSNFEMLFPRTTQMSIYIILLGGFITSIPSHESCYYNTENVLSILAL